MDLALIGLVLYALIDFVVFFLLYWTIRLAIRHERDRERRG